MSKKPIRKEIKGTVASNKMDKTIVVAVNKKVKHQFYGKYIKRTTKYYAHDPENQCQEGDQVRIRQTRPLSKLKRWELVEILNK
ncbi:MAG: 30S ribosomal protein S17 [Candidatus Marinimicrobia bacterium]|nr:30S ribosomal protein S17 [Candidatus Neomarinimicrobiota bacterium]